MNTTIVVIKQPADDHPIRISREEKRVLIGRLTSLDKFIGGRDVAVLSSSAPNVTCYAQSIATHFGVDLASCECLSFEEDQVNDGCDCVEDYLDPQFGLVVAIAANGVAEKLASSLARHVKRPCMKVHSAGMNDDMYIIE